MRYRVVAFEKHPVAGQDYTKAEAGETVGILLEPIDQILIPSFKMCNCPACTTEVATQNRVVGELHEPQGSGKDK